MISTYLKKVIFYLAALLSSLANFPNSIAQFSLPNHPSLSSMLITALSQLITGCLSSPFLTFSARLVDLRLLSVGRRFYCKEMLCAPSRLHNQFAQDHRRVRSCFFSAPQVSSPSVLNRRNPGKRECGISSWLRPSSRITWSFWRGFFWQSLGDEVVDLRSSGGGCERVLVRATSVDRICRGRRFTLRGPWSDSQRIRS